MRRRDIAQESIDRYDYSFWVVKRVEDIKCKCVDPVTKDADPKCKHCLGLGHKIKIYQVKGASRESKEFETVKSDNVSVTPKIFYVKTAIYVDRSDLIVDDENVFIVYARQYHRGENGEFKFTRCVCPDFKHNRNIFMKNFKELINEYKLRKK